MLDYSDLEDPVPLAARKPNGGMYTGAPFRPGAAWANVPIEPEVHVLAQRLPAGSMGIGHAPFGVRPGNNAPHQIFHAPYDAETHPGIMCLR